MNATAFRFLSVDDVLEIHEMQLKSYGGGTQRRAEALGLSISQFRAAILFWIIFSSK